jgi:sulfur relay (sulfurtransferase) DsrC/TusE family protein
MFCKIQSFYRTSAVKTAITKQKKKRKYGTLQYESRYIHHLFGMSPMIYVPPKYQNQSSRL